MRTLPHDPLAVRDMFTRIAPGYDLLNRLLSLRIDTLWRARLAAESGLKPGGRVLDLCTGTGDVLLDLHRRIPGVTGVGLDFSAGMLALAGPKLKGLPFELVQGDALATPFKAGSFDACSMAFGLRNLVDVPKGLAEMRRVLKPGGRVLVLELTRPRHPLMKLAYWPYLHLWLPLMGRLLSPDGAAYRYLRDTIELFYGPDQVLAMMAEAGLAKPRALPLMGGLATLFIGDVPIKRRKA
jgi:demethylmenaquinone methyltransferase/2-methoxy-6-polyprenyl-1,4-benzoquinol methylase